MESIRSPYFWTLNSEHLLGGFSLSGIALFTQCVSNPQTLSDWTLLFSSLLYKRRNWGAQGRERVSTRQSNSRVYVFNPYATLPLVAVKHSWKSVTNNRDQFIWFSLSQNLFLKLINELIKILCLLHYRSKYWLT